MRAPLARDLVDELGVAGPVEDDHGHVAQRLAERLGHRLEVLGGRAPTSTAPDRLGARPPASPCRRTGPGLNMVPRSRDGDDGQGPAAPQRREVGAVDGVDGDVGGRRRAVADALAVVEHGRVVLLALADHDDTVHGHGLQHHPHGLDGGAVGPLLVAAAHPPARGHGRGLGDTDELHGEVAVRCAGVGRHARP